MSGVILLCDKFYEVDTATATRFRMHIARISTHDCIFWETFGMLWSSIARIRAPDKASMEKRADAESTVHGKTT